MRADNQIPVACFAPPLTDEKLTEYRAIGQTQNAEVADAFKVMLACVDAWWNLPESKRTDGRQLTIKHRGKDTSYSETPLEIAHVKALDLVTPWMWELDALAAFLDKLPLGKVRDAAHHLLWHCKEITLDREPMTMNLLG